MLVDVGWLFDFFFGLEYGLDGCVWEGEFVSGGVDCVIGIFVCSLYGVDVCFVFEDLFGLDVVFVDFFDVGVCFYMYIWMMSYMFEVCVDVGVFVVVFDCFNLFGGWFD